MCVEVSSLDESYIHVRNSRAPQVIVSFDREEWAAFIDGVRAGDFALKTDQTADAEDQLDQV